MLYLAREKRRQLGCLDIALRGLAVTFAVATDSAPRLELGGRRVAGPDPRASILTMMGDGATVSVDAGDLRALGLSADRLLPGVRCDEPEEATLRWTGYDAVWFL